MVKTYQYGRITWIDLENPTAEEISVLAQSHKLHHLVVRELFEPSNSSKAVVYKEYVYLVLQFPLRSKLDDHHIVVDHEIDFVIGNNYIITTHYKAIEALEHFAKTIETNSILEKEKIEDSTGHLFYYITKRMYGHMRRDIEEVTIELSTAEDRIFRDEEKEMVEVISNLSRELLDFRQTCRAHFETLELLEKAKGDFFDQTFAPYVADIKENFIMVRDAVVNGHELAKELRETNDSLLNARQNDIIKTLTVFAFIFYPATFIAELFTIPATHVPLVGSSYGWMIIFSTILFVTIVIWLVIKKKRWI